MHVNVHFTICLLRKKGGGRVEAGFLSGGVGARVATYMDARNIKRLSGIDLRGAYEKRCLLWSRGDGPA